MQIRGILKHFCRNKASGLYFIITVVAQLQNDSMGERIKVSIKHVRTMFLASNLVNIRRTEIKQQGENMVHGTVKGIQRERMTRSEEGVINSFDIFKEAELRRGDVCKKFSFYCTVLIFTAFSSYALLIFYL